MTASPRDHVIDQKVVATAADLTSPREIEKMKRANAQEQKLHSYIERTVASAPPLSADQKSRLAALLTGGV